MHTQRRADLEHCRAIVRRGGYHSSAYAIFVPDRSRDDATVLYAFCRLVDDAVDLKERPEEELRAYAERLERIYAGDPVEHPVDRLMAELVGRGEIPRVAFEWLWEGFEWDVEGRRYETSEELLAYCVRVSGSIGVMLSCLGGVREERALYRACDSGCAFGLTDIVRDHLEDKARGRDYLPRQLLLAHRRDRRARAPSAGEAAIEAEAVSAALDELLDLALVLFDRAEAGIALGPRASWIPVLESLLIYRDLAERLRGKVPAAPGAIRPAVGGELSMLSAAAFFRGPSLEPPRRPLPHLEQAVPLVEAILAQGPSTRTSG